MKYHKVKKEEIGTHEFYEKQTFKIWWVRALLIFSMVSVAGAYGYGIYEMIGNKEPIDAATILFSALMVVFMGIINYMLLFGYLETVLTKNGIYFRMIPFTFKYRHIPLNDIESFFARQYSPIGEYGGWGIKKGIGNNSGWVWNAYGNQGIQLVFKDGTRLLLGSQKPEEFEKALEKILVKN